MSSLRLLVCASFAALPVLVAAQTPKSATDPTDPAATVPPVAYRSAFAHYRSHAEETSPPSERWRAANAQVRALGGHGGHMKDDAAPTSNRAEDAHAGHGAQRKPGK